MLIDLSKPMSPALSLLAGLGILSAPAFLCVTVQSLQLFFPGALPGAHWRYDLRFTNRDLLHRKLQRLGYRRRCFRLLPRWEPTRSQLGLAPVNASACTFALLRINDQRAVSEFYRTPTWAQARDAFWRSSRMPQPSSSDRATIAGSDLL